MRAALIVPLAALIFLAGYITASYAVLNRVSTAASRLVLDISDILFRVQTLKTRQLTASRTWCSLRWASRVSFSCSSCRWNA